MKRFWGLAIGVWLAWPQALPAALPSSCASCHKPAAASPKAGAVSAGHVTFADTACTSCHLDIVTKPQGSRPLSPHAIEAMLEKRTYLKARPLQFTAKLSDGRQVQRYNQKGLLRFLASPVPRWPESQNSMYPLSPAQLQGVASHLAGVGYGAEGTIPPVETEQGKALFAARGCASCHGTNNAPRLRIGRQLLSWEYFKAKVAGEVESAEASKMPSFAMAERDAAAIYAYISSSGADLPKVNDGATDGRLLLGRKLFAAVNKNVLSTSCRHCHSSSAKAVASISHTFGRSQNGKFALFRTEKGEIRTAKASLRAFQTGPDCQPSLLVKMLRERQREWQGKDDPSITGMPLTIAPLPAQVIEQAHLWTTLGCPSPEGELCKPCS